MVLWLSTDFGDYRTFWWGAPPKPVRFPKTVKKPAGAGMRIRAKIKKDLEHRVNIEYSLDDLCDETFCA